MSFTILETMNYFLSLLIIVTDLNFKNVLLNIRFFTYLIPDMHMYSCLYTCMHELCRIYVVSYEYLDRILVKIVITYYFYLSFNWISLL